MDDETRAAFGRMDRYFELSQAQHLELRGDNARIDAKVSGIDAKVQHILARLDRLERQNDPI
jgi:hypothetical protein